MVLAIQFPLWTILLLVPFAWEFLRTKEEQGFFEAYGYIAALLLTSVAHRGYCHLLTAHSKAQHVSRGGEIMKFCRNSSTDF